MKYEMLLSLQKRQARKQRNSYDHGHAQRDITCSRKTISVSMSRKICYSGQASALQFQQAMSMYVMHSGLGLKQAAPEPVDSRNGQTILKTQTLG